MFVSSLSVQILTDAGPKDGNGDEHKNRKHFFHEAISLA
jgi:hypothetical protein